ncbi:MAG: hypothetical protein PHW18_08230 [Sulfuricurvum sp.]|uniref:hypothetical protein n=1 Tax=Sulfuricurvum sp. TaxID=2025608 RepID=UPI002602023C|nr:hypothetical protein [Sulfuricurvum sp.]MDD2829544.1 hypothetical protein [Sulfuricurvum sp.]MDD4950476.1 hypothetical protein [Sulfuricurvum sp.]
MNTQSKHNGNIKISLLQILLKSTLVIGLSACNSSAIQFSNINAKGDKAMFNEIYNSKIKPDNYLGIQKNYAEVTNMVMKYFQIGESKEEVITKLSQMKIDSNVKSDGRIVAFGIKGNNPLFSKDDDKTVEVFFEFDSNNKLVSISSRYFRRQ